MAAATPSPLLGGLYALWFTVLCILSSLSHPGPHVDIVGLDKVEHTCYFWAGGVVLGLARRPGKWLALGIVLTGAAVGWFDEWHQTFTPGRSGLDVYDWLADCVGSALAAASLRRVRASLAAASLP